MLRLTLSTLFEPYSLLTVQKPRRPICEANGQDFEQHQNETVEEADAVERFRSALSHDAEYLSSNGFS